MERVRQGDRLEEVPGWAVIALGLAPAGTAFVPVAEKKYLISRVRRVITLAVPSAVPGWSGNRKSPVQEGAKDAVFRATGEAGPKAR